MNLFMIRDVIPNTRTARVRNLLFQKVGVIPNARAFTSAPRDLAPRSLLEEKKRN